MGIVRLKALETTRINQRTVYPEDLQVTLADIQDVPQEEDSDLIEVVKTLLTQLGD